MCLVANIRPSATSVCFLSITAAHPGVESILLWRIVSIGCCPKVSPKSVTARRTSLKLQVKLWSSTQAGSALRVAAKISLSLIFE